VLRPSPSSDYVFDLLQAVMFLTAFLVSPLAPYGSTYHLLPRTSPGISANKYLYTLKSEDLCHSLLMY
jgi:hypothetical protein